MHGSAAETTGRDWLLIAGRERLVGASLAQSPALLLTDRRHRRALESKTIVTVTYKEAGEFDGACRSARADVRLGVFRHDRNSAYLGFRPGLRSGRHTGAKLDLHERQVGTVLLQLADLGDDGSTSRFGP